MKDKKTLNDSFLKEIENLAQEYENQKEISNELENINSLYTEKITTHENTIETLTKDIIDLKITFEKESREQNFNIVYFKNKLDSKNDQVEHMQSQHQNTIKQFENKKHNDLFDYFDITEKQQELETQNVFLKSQLNKEISKTLEFEMQIKEKDVEVQKLNEGYKNTELKNKDLKEKNEQLIEKCCKLSVIMNNNISQLSNISSSKKTQLSKLNLEDELKNDSRSHIQALKEYSDIIKNLYEFSEISPEESKLTTNRNFIKNFSQSKSKSKNNGDAEKMNNAEQELTTPLKTQDLMSDLTDRMPKTNNFEKTFQRYFFRKFN